MQHKHELLYKEFFSLSKATDYLACSKLDTIFTTRTSCRKNKYDISITIDSSKLDKKVTPSIIKVDISNNITIDSLLIIWY